MKWCVTMVSKDNQTFEILTKADTQEQAQENATKLVDNKGWSQYDYKIIKTQNKG